MTEECEGGHPLIEGTIHCTSWTCANPECVEGHTRVDAMKINELKRELGEVRTVLGIYADTMEDLQYSRGYGRYHLGWRDGIHFPVSDSALEDAMQEYEIDEDDDEWIEGFNEGQAALRRAIE